MILELELTPRMRPKSPGAKIRPVTGSILPPVASTVLMLLMGLLLFVNWTAGPGTSVTWA